MTKKRLILTTDAMHSIEFDVSKDAKKIVRAMIRKRHIKVASLLHRFRIRRKNRYAIPRRKNYEKAIEAVLRRALGFEFREKIVETSRYQTRWIASSDGSEGYFEFFYNGKFNKLLDGNPDIYQLHPYREMFKEVPYMLRNDGAEADLESKLYIAIMAEAIDEFRPFWKNSSREEEGISELERITTEAIKDILRREPQNELYAKIQYCEY